MTNRPVLQPNVENASFNLCGAKAHPMPELLEDNFSHYYKGRQKPQRVNHSSDNAQTYPLSDVQVFGNLKSTKLKTVVWCSST